MPQVGVVGREQELDEVDAFSASTRRKTTFSPPTGRPPLPQRALAEMHTATELAAAREQ